MDGVELRNWAGNITFSTERLHRPTSVEELQELVASSDRIRALGSGHSFNRVADTTGDLVTVRDLAGEVTIDPENRTADVPAGARYGEVTIALQAQGWALHNLGSLPHISVAGACATGTHGSGVKNGNLSTAARAIEFVRADGEVVKLSQAEHPNTFPGAVLSLGALGITARLTLAIEPTYDVRQHVWLDLPTTNAIEHVDEITAAGYSVSLFTDWSRPDTIDKVWVKSRDDTDAPAERWGARLASTPQHPITGQDTDAATEQLGVPGPWNERLPHFRLAFTPSAGEEQQTEYLLPREHAGAAIAALRGIAGTIRDALQVCEIRTIAADELWLSPSHGRDTVALHFTWVDDDALVHRAVQAIETAIAGFDPRPHWGKVFLMDPAQVRSHYPQLPAFQQLAQECDPNRKLGNAYLERFVY